MKYPAIVLVCLLSTSCKSNKAATTSYLSADRFDVIAADAEVVGGFSFSLFRKAYIYKKYIEPHASEFEWSEDEIVGKCGFNPIESIDSILWAGHSASEKAIVSIAGLPKEKMQPCLKLLAAEQSDVELLEDGPLTRVNGPDGQSVWIGWQGASTLIIGSPKVDKQYFLDRLAGKDSVKSNAALVSLLKSTNQKAAFWIAAIPQSDSPFDLDQSDSPLPPVVGAFWAIDLNAGLATEVGLRLKSPAAASDALATLTLLMEQLKPEDEFERALFEKIETKVSGVDLTISLGISGAEIDKLINEISSEFSDFFEGGGLTDMLEGILEEDSPVEPPTAPGDSAKPSSTLVVDCGATLQGKSTISSAGGGLSVTFLGDGEFRGGLQFTFETGFTGAFVPPPLSSEQLVAITTASMITHGTHCWLDSPPAELGSVQIEAYDPAQGIVKAEFHALRLRSCHGDKVTECTINGAIETTGLGSVE